MRGEINSKYGRLCASESSVLEKILNFWRNGQIFLNILPVYNFYMRGDINSKYGLQSNSDLSIL